MLKGPGVAELGVHPRDAGGDDCVGVHITLARDQRVTGDRHRGSGVLELIDRLPARLAAAEDVNALIITDERGLAAKREPGAKAHDRQGAAEGLLELPTLGVALVDEYLPSVVGHAWRADEHRPAVDGEVKPKAPVWGVGLRREESLFGPSEGEHCLGNALVARRRVDTAPEQRW